MRRFALLCILVATVPAVAQEPAANPPLAVPSAPSAPAAEVAPEVAAQKVLQCEGEKFVFAWGAGSNPTKVTLCAKKGASREETIAMLEEAASKLESNTNIAEDRRIPIVQQIRGKIAELRGVETANVAATKPAVAKPVSVPGITPLKPIAPPPPAPPSVHAASTPSSSVLLLPKPKLSFECYTPGDIGVGGPCVALNRETRMTVKAGEAIPAATSLRFTRNREFRAEIAIGPMRKGQTRRLMVPRQVCGGVVDTEIEIQVARGNHVVDTRGPYLMRC
ncbi:MAG: hypothetical protein ACLGHC_02190 [Alphaproteobacteria bacterium]